MSVQVRTKKVTFNNADGIELAALLDQPRHQPRATVLFAHCFTCTKNLRSVRVLSHGLVDRGFAVLRFDFTGLGDSSGEFATSTFSTNIDDLIAAADYLRKEYQAPSLLVGHSLGGAAVLLAAPRIAEVKAVATLGAPSDLDHLAKGVLRDVDPQSEVTEVSIGGRPFLIGGQLVRDLGEHRLLESLAEMRKPILIMHSPVDDIVSIDHARRLYEAARHPKSFVSLDGADHLLLKDSKDAVFVAEVLSSWASRYVPSVGDVEGAEASLGAPLPAGVVQVEGGEDLYTNTVTTERHRLTTDEPEKVGGADLGPNPYEMLLAGLGSCISITLRMYADHKGMPLERVRVRLRHSRQHARDCVDCDSTAGMIDVIEKQLELVGPDLTEEQMLRLGEISARCPVHKTLTTETKVRSVDHFD